MRYIPLQASLLALLWQARKVELVWIKSLSEDECEVNGTQEHWSAKDLLAHIAAWKERGAEILTAFASGQVPPVLQSLDQFNEERREASQHRSWQEVQEESFRAFTALVAQVEKLPEEVFVSQEEIIWQIMACGGKHPYRHLAEFFLQRGEVQRAMNLYQELIEEVRQMPLPPEELGRVIYQLACFSVLAGQLTTSIEAFQEALHLEPRVIEWIKQERTLDSLLPLPAFQALLSGMPTGEAK